MTQMGDGRVEALGPAVVAVTADNPGPLTLDGTRTWIIGTERVAVVDPGPDDPAHLDRVDAVVGGRPVVAVCLTHAHADHSASAGDAADRWGELRAHPDTLARLGLDARPLADGEVLELGDGAGGAETLIALATPGHSGDHLAFLFLPTREILTGDLVLGRGSSMVAHPDGAVGAYLASLARIGSLRPTRLLPGHGPAIEDAAARLAEYAAHRLERTRQLRAAIEAGSRSMADMLFAVYGELPDGVRHAAELSLRAHLRHLEESGYEIPSEIDGRTDLK